jgi:hypothetical protein
VSAWLKSPLESLFPELQFLDPAEETVASLVPHITRGKARVACVATASDEYPFDEFKQILAKLKIPLIAELVQQIFGLLELVPSYWIDHCLTHVAYAVAPEMRNQLCFYLPENPFTEYRRANWCRPTDFDL